VGTGLFLSPRDRDFQYSPHHAPFLRSLFQGEGRAVFLLVSLRIFGHFFYGEHLSLAERLNAFFSGGLSLVGPFFFSLGLARSIFSGCKGISQGMVQSSLGFLLPFSQFLAQAMPRIAFGSRAETPFFPASLAPFPFLSGGPDTGWRPGQTHFLREHSPLRPLHPVPPSLLRAGRGPLCRPR